MQNRSPDYRLSVDRFLTALPWAIATFLTCSASLQAQSALPDLTINAQILQSSVSYERIHFKSTDCALVEGCIGAAGWRNLMRFSVATPNIGTADLILGPPENNPLFVYSPCHGHYHFSGYAKYELLDQTGTVILTGRKQAFCLEDITPYTITAGASHGYTCENQGITVGWQDIYTSNLDCQWLDVTGIPAGSYVLRVTINPERLLEESNYDNNVAQMPVTIPARFRTAH